MTKTTIKKRQRIGGIGALGFFALACAFTAAGWFAGSALQGVIHQQIVEYFGIPQTDGGQGVNGPAAATIRAKPKPVNLN